LLQYKYMSVPVQKYITGTSSVEICAAIEKAVRDGRIAPGDKLPTVRALAEQLAVSPTTVNASYRSLRLRGVLTARGRNGTSVSAAPPIATPPWPRVPEGLRNLFAGNPDKDLLPPLAGVLGRLDPTQRLYDAEVKSPQLLEQAAARLGRDGVDAPAVCFASGALDGMERVLQVYLRPGDRVIVEDPGWVGVLDLLGALGLVAVPVAVDDSGFVADRLQLALSRGAHALIVTPRAQNPMGSAMDAQRARALRTIVRKHPDLLLIEDDHAADVAGAPLHTLTRGWRGPWVYTRSVSKSLGPDLRLAVIAGDAATIARLEGRLLMGMRWVSHILQQIVAELWSDRKVDAMLAAAESTYTMRRAALISALAEHDIPAYGSSGMNVWIPVADEAAVAQGLRDAGWAVAPGRRFRIDTKPGIRVTVSALSPADARRFADALAAVLRPSDVVPAV
jgi:DNA-binding transcriptional MocR family regulator